jgi:hypothetical protein
VIGILTKVSFERHIYTYYATARYIADKPWQALSFISLAVPPLAKNIILFDFWIHRLYWYQREKKGRVTIRLRNFSRIGIIWMVPVIS